MDYKAAAENFLYARYMHDVEALANLLESAGQCTSDAQCDVVHVVLGSGHCEKCGWRRRGTGEATRVGQRVLIGNGEVGMVAAVETWLVVDVDGNGHAGYRCRVPASGKTVCGSLVEYGLRTGEAPPEAEEPCCWGLAHHAWECKNHPRKRRESPPPESIIAGPAVIPSEDTPSTSVHSSSVVAERDAYLANLTAVQARCTELLEENRKLKKQLAVYGPQFEGFLT